MTSPVIDQNPMVTHDDPADQVVQETPDVDVDVDVDDGDALLRRSQRTRRHAISGDYVVYLQEYEFDVGNTSDPSIY